MSEPRHESLIVYPSLFPIKVMGLDQPGFADAIVPTSASLMGVLAVARIGWGTWAKWQIKMQGVFFVLGSIAMVIAVAIGFN